MPVLALSVGAGLSAQEEVPGYHTGCFDVWEVAPEYGAVRTPVVQRLKVTGMPIVSAGERAARPILPNEVGVWVRAGQGRLLVTFQREKELVHTWLSVSDSVLVNGTSPGGLGSYAGTVLTDLLPTCAAAPLPAKTEYGDG